MMGGDYVTILNVSRGYKLFSYFHIVILEDQSAQILLLYKFMTIIFPIRKVVMLDAWL